jgi:hypothetical protein
VLENAAIPIVGEGESEPKDTYVDQHVASAKASIDQGSRLGVVNRARAAFMGTIARSARFEQVTLSQEVCGHESTAGVARLRKLFIPRYSY